MEKWIILLFLNECVKLSYIKCTVLEIYSEEMVKDGNECLPKRNVQLAKAY